MLSDELRDNSIVVETELAVDLPKLWGTTSKFSRHSSTLSITRRRRWLGSLPVRSRSWSGHGARATISWLRSATSVWASRTRRWSLSHSSPRKSRGWAWAYRSLARSSRRMADGFGRQRTRTPGRQSVLPCRWLRALSVSHAVEQMRPIMPLPLDARSPALHERRQQLPTVKRFFKCPIGFDVGGVLRSGSGRPVIQDDRQLWPLRCANRRSSNPSISGMPMSEIKQSMSESPPRVQTALADVYDEHRSLPPRANRQGTRVSDRRRQRRPPRSGRIRPCHCCFRRSSAMFNCPAIRTRSANESAAIFCMIRLR